jgi:bifunctional ADP-heptose synthase (sugar kinase/adenylyltransferase)
VANHAAAFCERVTLLTFLGRHASQEDASHEDFVREHTRAEIEKIFLYMEHAPTIVKKRFLESYPFQKLFEVYVMDETDPRGVQSAALCARLAEILPAFDAVLVADYGHGMISPQAADLLSARAKFLAITTQVNAGNHGLNTASKYRRADYVCISEQELRLNARSPQRDLREIVRELSDQLGCERIVVTRGREGCLCYSGAEGFCEIPAFTGRVVDRLGAGDAVLAVTAMCAAQNTPMEIVGVIGNCAGAQAVGVVGNRTSVERVPLTRYIECLLK